MYASFLQFYRLLRLTLGRRAALIGAYALGLYGPGYYVIGTLAKEPLALLLSISALDGTSRYLKWGRSRHAMIAGLSLGALAMTRLEYGWVITVTLGLGLIWWLLARFRQGAPERTSAARRWTLVCALGMLACVPWLIYTYVLTGDPFYWGNSGGLSLYWMSSPNPSQLGEWHAVHTVFNDPTLAGYRPFFHYLQTLAPVPRDLLLDHIALAHALAHPAKYALNVLANLGRMFVGFPFSFTLPIAAIVGLILINGLLIGGLVAAGVWLIRARSSLPRETLPFVLFASVAFVAHLLPTAEPRMIVPLIPIPIWLIAQALHGRRAASRSAKQPFAQRLPAAQPRRLAGEMPVEDAA